MSKEYSSILQFLHQFPRFPGTPTYFAPYDIQYQYYLRTIISISSLIGFLIFGALIVLLLRRWRFAKEDAFAFRYSFSTDLSTILLLGLTTLSAFSGLLGEATLDRSVHTISHAMHNSSHSFNHMISLGGSMLTTIHQLNANADDFSLAYSNISQITQLAHSATEMRQYANELSTIYDTLPSKVLEEKASKWKHAYKWMKGSTNTVIVGILCSCILSIIAIGWSFPATIRWALLIVLWIFPMAHTLVGFYLAGSIGGADYCIHPENNTIPLFYAPNIGTTTQLEMFHYYIDCNASSLVFSPNEMILNHNSSSPFSHDLNNIGTLLPKTKQVLDQLKTYAKNNHLQRMEMDYLVPIQSQLDVIWKSYERLRNLESCSAIHENFKVASNSFCENGVMGTFSLWIHQSVLCLLLLICVICIASVWERIEAREERLDVQYGLLASYEEDDADHVYLTSD